MDGMDLGNLEENKIAALEEKYRELQKRNHILPKSTEDLLTEVEFYQKIKDQCP